MVVAAALAIFMTGAALTILVTGAAFTVLMTRAALTVLMTGAAFSVLVTRAALTVLVTGTTLGTVLVVTAVVTFFVGVMVAAAVTAFAGIVVAAIMTALGTVVAAALTITMTGTSTATALALLHTAASGQFGAGSRISLHVVGIVTQLAHLLTQLVGIGSLRIIVDGQLRRLHVIIVRLHTLEIRHILFEFVGALLTDAIGLDGHGLLTFGGRFALLCTHAQRNQAY